MLDNHIFLKRINVFSLSQFTALLVNLESMILYFEIYCDTFFPKFVHPHQCSVVKNAKSSILQLSFLYLTLKSMNNMICWPCMFLCRLCLVCMSHAVFVLPDVMSFMLYHLALCFSNLEIYTLISLV